MADREAPRDKQSLDKLERSLDYKFRDKQILEQALTHASFRSSSGQLHHYEKLEFLGDRVLGLCVAERLYIEFPDADEGELSVRLNALVSGKTLAEFGDELNIDQFIRTGSDLNLSTGKRVQSLRADVVEALIASIYLDGGLEPAKNFVSRLLDNRINQPDAARRDSKTALQEWAHAKGLGTPKYREKEKAGPDHDPVFTVEVKVKGKLAAQGTGRSKRSAEQAAAREILVREGVWDDSE